MTDQLVLAEIEADLNNQVVAQIRGRAVTRGDLSAAFDRVSNKANWKNPIDAVIEARTRFEREVISAAVQFFAGCIPTFEQYREQATRRAMRGIWRVRAAGYYATIGA